MSCLSRFGRWAKRGEEEGASQGQEGISCGEAVSVVQEFLDGALDDADAEDVEAHFEMCTRCYPHLAFERSFREALTRVSKGQEAPEELKSRVTDLLARVAGRTAGEDEEPES